MGFELPSSVVVIAQWTTGASGNNKVYSVWSLGSHMYITQGSPLQPSELGFMIGYFPNIYSNFYVFICFLQDNKDWIFLWSTFCIHLMYT